MVSRMKFALMSIPRVHPVSSIESMTDGSKVRKKISCMRKPVRRCSFSLALNNKSDASRNVRKEADWLKKMTEWETLEKMGNLVYGMTSIPLCRRRSVSQNLFGSFLIIVCVRAAISRRPIHIPYSSQRKWRLIRRDEHLPGEKNGVEQGEK